jgi:hypothetical protein
VLVDPTGQAVTREYGFVRDVRANESDVTLAQRYGREDNSAARCRALRSEQSITVESSRVYTATCNGNMKWTRCLDITATRSRHGWNEWCWRRASACLRDLGARTKLKPQCCSGQRGREHCEEREGAVGELQASPD